jgi:enoyl-CoA hydratase
MTPSSDFSTLDVVRDGSVVEVHLCRPDVMNRFDWDLHTELEVVMRDLAKEVDVNAVVLTSSGRFFSAGGDVQTILDSADDPKGRWVGVDQGRSLFRAVADLPKPLVVALQGDVYGLGATIAFLADAIVTTPTARIADTHVLMGIAAGDGGCVSWPVNMGLVKAKRHLLTGEPITGKEAHRLGIVSDLVDEPDEVRPAAIEIARKIAALPPMAVQLTKRALNKVVQARADEVLDLAFYLESVTFGTRDAREAVEAFRAKRDPEWKGY